MKTKNFEEWIETEEGKKCMPLPVSHDEYMRNRLWWAYKAGTESSALQPTIDWYEIKLKEQREEIRKLKLQIRREKRADILNQTTT